MQVLTKTIQMVDILKKIGFLMISTLLQLVLMIPRSIVLLLQLLEGLLRIIEKTLTFFIKEFESEVLNK